MTVAEYIFAFLEKKGCSVVYMVSGSSAMWLTDALYKNSGLKTICCHHEQAAAMAADAYGRVHKAPGVCMVTVGPGATNAITGVAEAYVDSSAMFVISGQTNARHLQYEIDTGIRQKGTQSLNLEPLVTSVTKYFAAVMKAEDIRFHMERAYAEATSGRKGPVWIDVPVDVQNTQVPTAMNGYDLPKEEKANRKINYPGIMQRIQAAKRPLILAGKGVRDAEAVDEVEQLCEELQIPLVTSRGGIDVAASENDWFVGRPGAYGDRASHFAIQACDFLLILGSRLSVSTIGYYPDKFAEKAFKIMVDADSLELEKNDVPIDEKYCLDVKTFLCDILDCSEKLRAEGEHAAWKAQCQKWKREYPNVLDRYQEEQPLSEYWVTKRIAEYVDGACNIVVDTGSVCNVVSQSWILKRGQRYLISGGLSCMGFWAAAIGAYEHGKQLVAVTGDGSMQMNIQELATIAYNRIPLKIFIYDNNGYMLIRHNQHNYMKDRFLGVGPDSGIGMPDFCKVAEGYGIKAFQVGDKAELETVLPEIMQANEPVLCDIKVQEFAPIIPRIASRVMPDGSLRAAEFDDLYPFLEAETNRESE